VGQDVRPPPFPILIPFIDPAARVPLVSLCVTQAFGERFLSPRHHDPFARVARHRPNIASPGSTTEDRRHCPDQQIAQRPAAERNAFAGDVKNLWLLWLLDVAREQKALRQFRTGQRRRVCKRKLPLLPHCDPVANAAAIPSAGSFRRRALVLRLSPCETSAGKDQIGPRLRPCIPSSTRQQDRALTSAARRKRR
jgi:hypothetical protein